MSDLCLIHKTNLCKCYFFFYKWVLTSNQLDNNFKMKIWFNQKYSDFLNLFNSINADLLRWSTLKVASTKRVIVFLTLTVEMIIILD